MEQVSYLKGKSDQAFNSIFVGYFPKSMDAENIASFLQSDCRDHSRICVGQRQKAGGNNVFFCRVDFEEKESALMSMNTLNGMRVVGLTLSARPWVRRTEANERRDVHWRQKNWHQGERRRQERRNYQMRYEHESLGRAQISTMPDAPRDEPICNVYDQYAIEAWNFWVKALQRPDAGDLVSAVKDAQKALNKVEEHDFLRNEMKSWLSDWPTANGMEDFKNR